MSEQENRNTLERLFQAFARHDLDAIDDLMHDDYVEEYPQSGERIRGKQATPSRSKGTSVLSKCSSSMTATGCISAR